MNQRKTSSALWILLGLLAVGLLLTTATVGALAYYGVKRYLALRAERAAVDSRLTADSDYDATSDVVDEDYRFRIRWPGPGTRMMRAKDARRLSRDALAAAFDETGCYGVVIAEDVPGGELEPMADLIIKNMGVQDRTDERRARGSVAGQDAVLYGLTGAVGGGKVHYEGAVFVHQDYVYQLVTWRPAASSRDCYAWFSSAFSLLEGPVTGRAIVATPDQDGVGWRLRGGQWRNAPYRLGVDPPKGFRVVVGDDLASMNKRALVGMSSASPQAHLLVFLSPSSPSDKGRLDALLREFAASVDTQVSDESIPVTIGASKVVLKRLDSAKQPAFEFVGGELLRDDSRVELIGWYGANDRAKGRARLLSGFGGIRLLDAAEADALGKELLQQPDPQVLIQDSSVVRGGVFRDFEFGVTLTKPAGFWEMSHDWLPSPSAKPRVTAVEHGRKLTAFVEAQRGDVDDADAAQKELLVRLVGGTPATKQAQPREVSPMLPKGHRAAYDIHATDGVWQYDITTASRDGRTVHLVTFGRKEDMTAAVRDVAALSSGLELGVAGLDPVRLEGNRLRDLRLGFEMSPPDAAWVSSPLPTAYGMKEIVDAQMWTKGAEAISVVAVHSGGDTDSEQFIVALMEQEVARRLGQGTPGVPRRSETTLAGHPARQLTWVGPTKVNLVLTNRMGTTYGVLLAQPLVGGTDLEKVKSGLKLLE